MPRFGRLSVLGLSAYVGNLAVSLLRAILAEHGFSPSQAALQAQMIALQGHKFGCYRIGRLGFAATLFKRQRATRAGFALPAPVCQAEEYRPSRRKLAVMPPELATRSVSSRIRSLSCAVRVRRVGRSDISGDVTAGAGTTVGLRRPAAPPPAVTSFSGFEVIGMIDVNLLRPRV